MGDTERSFFNLTDTRLETEDEIRERIRRTRQRLDYGAVSLDPYHAKHPVLTDKQYAHGSILNIENITMCNYLQARRDRTLEAESREKLYQIFGMVRASLMSAQTERMQHHNQHSLNNLPIVRTEEVIAAEEALATPSELLGILINNPVLESIELAKKSHPFVSDPEAVRGMDEAIVKALAPYEAQLFKGDWEWRTKVKGLNSDIPAKIVVTKSHVATIDLGDGDMVEIIRRRGSVVRADSAVSHLTDEPLYSILLNRAREGQLAHLVNTAVRDQETPAWLIPMTTSYYAHRVQVPTTESQPAAK